MSKKVINQNSNYDNELLDSIESNFIFNENPISRFRKTSLEPLEVPDNQKINKEKKLAELQKQLSSIEDCSLKNDSKKMVLGDGNINSSIMLIGEAPGVDEEIAGLTFMGEVGDLLKKMLFALNVKKKKYLLYLCCKFQTLK